MVSGRGKLIWTCLNNSITLSIRTPFLVNGDGVLASRAARKGAFGMYNVAIHPSYVSPFSFSLFGLRFFS